MLSLFLHGAMQNHKADSTKEAVFGLTHSLSASALQPRVEGSQGLLFSNYLRKFG